MLIVTEKPTITRKVSEALRPFLRETDEIINIFGQGWIEKVIPDGLPTIATSMEDLIKHDQIDVDRTMTLDALNYFMVRAILGSAGEAFRVNLKAMSVRHDEVVFMVDADFMSDVAERLADTLSKSMGKRCFVARLVGDLSEKSLRAGFEQRAEYLAA